MSIARAGWFLVLAACGEPAEMVDGGHVSPRRDAFRPPADILACESLSAVGEWENVGPMGFSAHDIELDPNHHGTVWLGAGAEEDWFDTRGVWRSNDCGATWEHVSTGVDAELVESGRNWCFLVDHQDPDTIYTCSGYGASGFYKSTTAGRDWIDITPTNPGAPSFVGGPEQMDPEDPQHILLTY